MYDGYVPACRDNCTAHPPASSASHRVAWPLSQSGRTRSVGPNSKSVGNGANVNRSSAIGRAVWFCRAKDIKGPRTEIGKIFVTTLIIEKKTSINQ